MTDEELDVLEAKISSLRAAVSTRMDLRGLVAEVRSLRGEGGLLRSILRAASYDDLRVDDGLVNVEAVNFCLTDAELAILVPLIDEAHAADRHPDPGEVMPGGES